MKTVLLYTKSNPIKTNSAFGKWLLLVRKTITYNDGLQRDMNGVIYFWTKKKAEEVFNTLKNRSIVL